jgi:hypothetical protein
MEGVAGEEINVRVLAMTSSSCRKVEIAHKRALPCLHQQPCYITFSRNPQMHVSVYVLTIEVI